MNMNYDDILTKCLLITTYRELSNYLNEIFKEYTFSEDVEVMNQFKKKVWEMVRENNLVNEVTDFVGFNSEDSDAEFGFAWQLKKPEDVYAGILHWVHCEIKQL